MATDAQNAKYLKKALSFATKLKEKGHEASFGNLAGNPAEPWNPSGGYVEAGTSFIFPSEWRQNFGDDVQADDLMFFVSNDVDLSNCRKMVDDSKEYSIIKVEPFKPDVDVIFYEIQVRK